MLTDLLYHSQPFGGADEGTKTQILSLLRSIETNTLPDTRLLREGEQVFCLGHMVYQGMEHLMICEDFEDVTRLEAARGRGVYDSLRWYAGNNSHIRALLNAPAGSA